MSLLSFPSIPGQRKCQVHLELHVLLTTIESCSGHNGSLLTVDCAGAGNLTGCGDCIFKVKDESIGCGSRGGW